MEHTTGGVSTRYYFQRNLQGDVQAIVNTSGTVVARYLYDAFGNCTVASGTTNTAVANANPIRYRGYYYDDDTGLYYCNARYYSPKWRRFISPDDTAYLDPETVNGLNLYCYSGNNPVRIVSIFSFPTYHHSFLRYTKTKTAHSATTTLESPSHRFHLFGYERRTSAGWESSPALLAGPLGIIGFSSYVTHTEGRSGMLYVFAGTTSNLSGFLETTYYAGVGIDLFGILGAEVQLETLGIGATISVSNFSISLNMNLLSYTALTFAWDTDLGNNYTRTTGVTIGINTVGLLALVASIYSVLTNGFPIPSTFPSPIPQPFM